MFLQIRFFYSQENESHIPKMYWKLLKGVVVFAEQIGQCMYKDNDPKYQCTICISQE